MILQPDSVVYDAEKNTYDVIEAIGNGAFGYVYKIQKQSDQSTWALKTLPTTFPNQQQLQAFINESAMAMTVTGDNVIKYEYVHDGATYPQLPPYIIMQFANGGTLYDVIKTARRDDEFIPNTELLEYFTQLINGMECINSVLVHRDIKPDNILINDGTVKISDFGLSKIVHDSTRAITFKGFGHLRYMAPEGWRNEKNTIQMDIYAMGITFYELATLRHPYDVKADADMQVWRDAHLFSPVSTPLAYNNSIDTTIAQVILKMVEKSTVKRYKTWDKIRKDLSVRDLPPTENSTLIDNLLNIRMAKDTSLRNQHSAEQKRSEEKRLYVKGINYQYVTDIVCVKPITPSFRGIGTR